MTTPYVTGTVAVTAGSAVVTGTGTGWQTSGLIAGEFGVDGLSVPVLSIDSNTKITLAQPWPGATASGKAYWISYDTTPGQQTVANAQRLAEYIARLDKPALAALASLVPAADKLPYFGAGGAGALFDFNAAARALLAGGVLSGAQLPERLRPTVKFVTDPNSIAESGFFGGSGAGFPNATEPFFIESSVWPDTGYRHQRAANLFNDQGSWSRFFQNSVWTGWRLAAGAVVGNVFNSNGLPAGAIIERGSNANGEYTRFADGTQICTTTYFPLPYLSGGDMLANWSFPAAFVGTPFVGITESQIWNVAVRNYSMNPRLLDVGSSSCSPLSANPLGTNQPGDIHYVHLKAEGRWF